MAFGLGKLKLSSAEFWAMTPRELAAAAAAFAPPSAPPGRGELDALISLFPDAREAAASKEE